MFGNFRNYSSFKLTFVIIRSLSIFIHSRSRGVKWLTSRSSSPGLFCGLSVFFVIFCLTISKFHSDFFSKNSLRVRNNFSVIPTIERVGETSASMGPCDWAISSARNSEEVTHFRRKDFRNGSKRIFVRFPKK